MAAGLKPGIHIVGGPGGGKSYAAAKLAKQFDVTAYDLDDLFWNSAAPNYGVRADLEQRDRRLAAIVEQEGWIIEGVYYQWLAPSFKAANVIIALTPSIWIRHWRVIRRFILRKLGTIPSRRESFADLFGLLRWSHGYDANNLNQARELLAAIGCNLVECKTFDDVVAATKIWPRG